MKLFVKFLNIHTIFIGEKMIRSHICSLGVNLYVLQNHAAITIHCLFSICDFKTSKLFFRSMCSKRRKAKRHI